MTVYEFTWTPHTGRTARVPAREFRICALTPAAARVTALIHLGLLLSRTRTP